MTCVINGSVSSQLCSTRLASRQRDPEKTDNNDYPSQGSVCPARIRSINAVGTLLPCPNLLLLPLLSDSEIFNFHYCYSCFKNRFHFVFPRCFSSVLLKPLFHTGFGGGFSGGHSTAPAGLNHGGVVWSFWASRDRFLTTLL